MTNKLLLNFKFFSSFVICLFAYLLICLLPPAASAQNLSLGIWPPLLEIMIQPGKSITQVYKLQNEGETDLVVKSSLVPFKPADEQGNTELNNQQLTISNQQFLDWFSFQNAELSLGEPFALKAGLVQEIVLKLKVPAGAKEDDYYATLLFETVSPAENLTKAGPSRSFSTIKIGSNILLTVSRTGEPVKKAEIKEFSISNIKYSISDIKLIDSFDRPEFLVRIKNTGRSFFKPMGTITTTGWWGQGFHQELLAQNILANSTRRIDCFSKEIPEATSALCRLSSAFLLGRYQAKLEFGLDKIGGQYQSELLFIALPFKLVIGLLTTVLLSFIIKSKLKGAKNPS